MHKTRQIEATCERHRVSLKAAAIQFPLHHPLVASVLTGSINAAQARENAQLIDVPIPDRFWRDLCQQGLIDPKAVVEAGEGGSEAQQ